MRIALYVLALLFIVAVIVYVVGRTLPQSHVATSSVRIARPAESVWLVMRNLGDYAAWWPNIKRVERISDERGREAWRQIDRHNSPLPMVVVEDDPPRRFVTEIIDKGMPFGGTWTYEVTPDGEGARVTITERGEVYNAFFRVISKVVMGHHGTMDSYLVGLGRHFGETVVPEHR